MQKGPSAPSSRTICSHYDNDPQPFVSDPNAVWNVPFYPAGSVDGKVTSAALMDKFQMEGVFGRADGTEFDVDEFLRKHPQWNWQGGYLQSRPAQQYAVFPPTN